MSRETSLVTTAWVEENIDNPSIVLIEVDEDTTSYDRGHIRNAISSTGRRTSKTRFAATSSTRSSSRLCCPRAASATITRSCSTAATTTRSRRTPTGTSSSTDTRT